MKVLVLGGTRFFGKHLVRSLLEAGHQVTVATRGLTADPFGNAVERVQVDHNAPKSMAAVFAGRRFDVVYDNLVYCSNAVRYTLDAVKGDRYIMTSSSSVYNPLKLGSKETDFNPLSYPLRWNNRENCSYAEGKRQAEAALSQLYCSDRNWVAVRFPFVLGEDDYTGRFRFYLSHLMTDLPMWIDNPESQMSFISSREAGTFLAWLVDRELTGAVNACSGGTISLKELLAYGQKKSRRKAVIVPYGEPAPFNGTPAYWLDTAKAERAGFQFTILDSWLYRLADRELLEIARERS